MTSQKNIIELDVRPILKAKGDPFKQIMETIKRVNDTEIFVLHATFKPLPLITLLKKKGFLHEAIQIEKSLWTVHFWKESKDE